jgi:hypothetical protein
LFLAKYRQIEEIKNGKLENEVSLGIFDRQESGKNEKNRHIFTFPFCK